MSQPTLAPPEIPPGEPCNDCALVPATRTVTIEMAVGEQTQSEVFHLHFCAACFVRWNHEGMP